MFCHGLWQTKNSTGSAVGCDVLKYVRVRVEPLRPDPGRLKPLMSCKLIVQRPLKLLGQAHVLVRCSEVNDAQDSQRLVIAGLVAAQPALEPRCKCHANLYSFKWIASTNEVDEARLAIPRVSECRLRHSFSEA